jgi:hypothetical protein
MLSEDLFREVRPAFLRILGAPGARVYLDAVDALASESALRTGALGRDEAVALVERVVEHYADVDLEETAGFSAHERARVVIERLIGADWLAAEDRVDYQRFISVEPMAVLLLEALRKIARPGAVEFSDKLVATCNLLTSGAMDEEPWQTIETCSENVRHGVQELRAVAKSVERHTQRQLAARSLRENLEVVFDQYAEQVGHGAYAELVHARLPTRLSQARYALDRLRNDPELLDRMAAEVQRRQGGEHSAAMARVQNRLHELGEALDRVAPSAEDVDHRTADFTRKSLARFRYLQEVTGEQRAIVQRFFEKLNTDFAGWRVNDAELAIGKAPRLRVCDVKLPAGLDSLYVPRLRHALGEVEPLDEEPSQEQLDHSRRHLAATLRNSLTILRANRFADEAFEKLGKRITSRQLMTSDDAKGWKISENHLADLIACLLHTGARGARFEVQVSHGLHDTSADVPQHDCVFGRTWVQRFILAKNE